MDDLTGKKLVRRFSFVNRDAESLGSTYHHTRLGRCALVAITITLELGSHIEIDSVARVSSKGLVKKLDTSDDIIVARVTVLVLDLLEQRPFLAQQIVDNGRLPLHLALDERPPRHVVHNTGVVSLSQDTADAVADEVYLRM